MIKRRFYRYEHGDKDIPSGTSSSSDSEVEAGATDESQDDDEENIVADVREKEESSSSSGYESEDSSANEVNLDSSGLPTSDDDDVTPQNGEQNIIGNFSTKEVNTLPTRAQHSPEKDEIHSDCVLRRNSVFKCRLCPRIVCLSEETLKAHLISKRHARSEKLLKEGRLKLMLNDKGQIEGEDHPENPAKTVDPGQKSDKSKKKGEGQRKQKKRSRQETKAEKEGKSRENRKTRRKNAS